MTPDVHVSIVIPVRNDAENLHRCLVALKKQAYPTSRLKIIVCDNGSTDDIAEVQKRHSDVMFIRECKPGSAAARNAAIPFLAGGVVAFVDADCIPNVDWIESALALFTARPDVDAIGGRIDVVPEHSDDPTAMESYDMAVNFRQRLYVERYRFAATANMIVRRRAFDDTGRFDDETFSFYGGEDRDWGIRFHAGGHVMVYAPDVVVRHPAQNDITSFLFKYANIVKSERLLHEKHGASFGKHSTVISRLRHPESRLQSVLSATRNLSFTSKMQLLLLHALECMVHAIVKIKMAIRLPK